jgi:N-acetylmuramoyl-L-alanine amidase
MPKVHVVAAGECLATIAARYGFADARALYEHPANSALRAKRPNPHVLDPGDEVAIPDPAPKVFTCSTGRAHRFVVTRPTRSVRLRLVDAEGKPLARKQYKLVDGAEVRIGQTDDRGELHEEVSGDSLDVTLQLDEEIRILRLGALNPASLQTQDGGVSGVQARLKNLGYNIGQVDGVRGRLTAEAIKAFQRKHGQSETGEIDGELLRALEREHGC